LEPFYFMSYDKRIGIARSVNELIAEMTRLAKDDPGALEYHLREGHIVEWLYYIGEGEIASQLKSVTAIHEALAKLKVHAETSRVRNRALHGRMR
jgi:hypothetical protein